MQILSQNLCSKQLQRQIEKNNITPKTIQKKDTPNLSGKRRVFSKREKYKLRRWEKAL